MGILYTVFPVSYHPDVPNWLESYGINIPPSSENSRHPSPQEIKDTLDNLEGFNVSYEISEQNWSAYIVSKDSDRKWANLHVLNFQGNEYSPHDFWFDKGDPEVNLLIVQCLSKICGPLIMCADADTVPVLVTSDTIVSEALEEWYERQASH